MSIEGIDFNSDAVQRMLEEQQRQEAQRQQQQELSQQTQDLQRQTNDQTKEAQQIQNITERTKAERPDPETLNRMNFGRPGQDLGLTESPKANPEARQERAEAGNNSPTDRNPFANPEPNFGPNSPYENSDANPETLKHGDQLAANKSLWSDISDLANKVMSNPDAQLVGLTSMKNSVRDQPIADQEKALMSLTNDPSSAKLLANLKYGADANSQSNFKDTAQKLIGIKDQTPNDPQTQSAFMTIAKNALAKDGLNSLEQSKIFSDILGSDPNMNKAQSDAMGTILGHLPNSKSAGDLVSKLSPIISDENLTPNNKNAQMLSQISNHLKETRNGDSKPATKDLHRDLVANLMNANGVDYKTANIAAKVLDHIPSDQKEQAIQLALGVARESDPLKTLTGDARTLAEKSGLTAEQAVTARKNITEAGLKLLEETAKEHGINFDRDQTISLLSKGDQTLMGADGKLDQNDIRRITNKLTQNVLDNPKTPEEHGQRNQANWQKEAQHQAQVRQGAYNKISNEAPRIFGIRDRMLGQAASWQPGYGGGRVQGQMNQAYFQTQGQANAAMRQEVSNQAYSKLNQSLPADKMQNLNDLSRLIDASGIKAEKPITDLRADNLKALEGFGQVTQALKADASALRISNLSTRSNEIGTFDKFTDKANNTEFYRLTSEGKQEQFAIKDPTTQKWNFLQGSNFSHNGKSYADTVASFRESQASGINTNKDNVQAEIVAESKAESKITEAKNNPKTSDLQFSRSNDGLFVYKDSSGKEFIHQPSTGNLFLREKGSSTGNLVKDQELKDSVLQSIQNLTPNTRQSFQPIYTQPYQQPFQRKIIPQ